MRRFCQSVVLGLALAGCQASPAEQADAAHDSHWNQLMKEAVRSAVGELKSSERIVPRGKKPEVIFNSTDIYINGQKLALGEDLSRWISVLGRPDRKFLVSGLYLWDDMGLTLVTSQNVQDKVVQFEVFLNDKPRMKSSNLTPVPGHPFPKFENHFPEGVFQGYVEVDGAGVDARSTVSDVNALMKAKDKFYCPWDESACKTGWRGAAGFYGFTFDTDTEQSHGVIFSLTVGLREY